MGEMKEIALGFAVGCIAAGFILLGVSIGVTLT